MTPVKQKRESRLYNLPVAERGVKRAADGKYKENTPQRSVVVPAPLPALAEVVTPKGKALRRKVAIGVKRCIAAPAAEWDMEKFEDELAPEALTYSPVSLTKVLYVKAMHKVKKKCHELGVTEAQMKARLEDARSTVENAAWVRKTLSAKPSQQEEEDFKRVARLFNADGFELRHDPSIPNAANEGSAVVANKSAMNQLSLVQRLAVYAHEITHGKNEDWTYRKAYHAEFDALGKDDLFQASVAPVLYRSQEVFADLVPGAKAATFAHGNADLRQAIAKAQGPGVPTTHPANDAWAALDESMVDLHAKYKEEQERLERITRLSQLSKRMRMRQDEAVAEAKLEM